ncbi:MAG: hypothetical protein ACKVYV_13920 [Limisphaerales bacterium]
MRMSVRESLKLNAWAGVAVIAACISRLLLRDSAGLAGVPRLAAALLPLLPGLLYVRALWRWMRGLDELQRRLQLEAVCFAALAMLLLALSADLLKLGGFLPRLTFGWEGYFAFTFFLYALGLARANRRYR